MVQDCVLGSMFVHLSVRPLNVICYLPVLHMPFNCKHKKYNAMVFHGIVLIIL